MLSCEDTSGEVRSCWITCVGLREGKSVELDHKRAGSWKHDISWVQGQVIVWVNGLVVSFV